MRFFLKLRYSGTDFHGWQRQPGYSTIQESLETALSTILNRRVQCHGCGRTDAGVHANVYYAHIDISIPETNNLVYRTNKVLHPNILLEQLLQVPPSAHAQKDARRRTYRYHLHLTKNPFLSHISAWHPIPGINLERMQDVSGRLPEFGDYYSYCKTPDRHDKTLCQIESAIWFRLDENRYCFEIKSDHFLRGMIRLLMGNMVDIGIGKLRVDNFLKHLEDRTQPKFFRMAPPQGLHLYEVEYPFPIIR